MTTSCVCPAELDQFHMIEYPGFVKNVDKALATMGGTSSIEKAFESQNDRLELKFRKADPLAHTAYGDKYTKKCLVLRITRKKDKTSDVDEDETKGFKIQVVGKIQQAFKYDTLAEFQWLPMQRTNLVESIKAEDVCKGCQINRTPESLNPKYVSILNDAIPIQNPFDNTLKGFNPEAPLLILPTLFSRFDTPREIHTPHPKFRSEEMRAEFERQQSMAIIGKTRKKRSTMSYLLNFGDHVPDKPPEKLLKERQAFSSQDYDMIPTLRRCFEKQKVWTKAALCLELNCTPLDIKFVLPIVAFHFITGPYSKTWVKYGYDPHNDSSSKILQTLDFRVRNPSDQQEYSKRSVNQYQIPLRKNPEKSRNSQQVDLKTVISRNKNQPAHMYDDIDGVKNLSYIEAMCKFRRDTIPQARQLSYHLKDIELEEVQEILHSNDGMEPIQCTERDGWLPEGSLDKIRKIMTKSLSKTFNQMTSQLELNQQFEGTSSLDASQMQVSNFEEVETTTTNNDLYETTS